MCSPDAVVRLLAPALAGEDHAKDVDFCRSGIQHRCGYADTKRVLAQSPWAGQFDPLEGLSPMKQKPAV
jgi:NTE family protein